MSRREHVAGVLVLLVVGPALAVGGVGSANAVTEVAAISFVDPGDADRTKVELAFDAALDDATVAAGDFAVADADGDAVRVAEIEHPAGANDGQVVLDLGTAVRSRRVSSVRIAADAITTAGGVAVEARTISVRSTSSTLRERSGGEDVVAFRGERVAVLADSPNEDLLIETGGGAFVFDGNTGPGSQLFVFETRGRALGTYRIVFDGRDRFSAADGDGAVRLRTLEVDVTLDDATVTTKERIAGNVSANVGSRDVEVSLVGSSRRVVATTTVTLSGEGEGSFAFEPQKAGTYTIEVRDLETGIAFDLAGVRAGDRGTVERPRPSFAVSNLRAPATARIGDRITVVATVANVGTGEGTERIRYRFDGRSVASQTVSLDAGASRTITFALRVPAVAPGPYEHGVFVGDTDRGAVSTLAVERPEPIVEVTDLRAPATARPGDTVTATARISNAGTLAETTQVQYRLDGRVLATRTIELDPGSSATVSLTATVPTLDPGTYTQGVFVGDSDRGRNATLSIPEPAPAFVVANLQAPPRATAGDEITVVATVLNTGEGAGSTAVEYRLDGEVLGGERVSLEAGERATVAFSVVIPERPPGVYAHGVFVDDTDEGATSSIVLRARTSTPTASPTPAVTPTPRRETTRETTTGVETPGFGVAAALLSVLVAFLAARRRA